MDDNVERDVIVSDEDSRRIQAAQKAKIKWIVLMSFGEDKFMPAGYFDEEPAADLMQATLFDNAEKSGDSMEVIKMELSDMADVGPAGVTH